MKNSISLIAPAKLNLNLYVKDKLEKRIENKYKFDEFKQEIINITDKTIMVVFLFHLF